MVVIVTVIVMALSASPLPSCQEIGVMVTNAKRAAAFAEQMLNTINRASS